MSIPTLKRMDEQGVLAAPDECEVCQEEYVFGGWDIVHGHAYCGHCGSLYNIAEIKGREAPKLLIKDEYVEPMREFYEEQQESTMAEREMWLDWLYDNYPELAEREA